MKTSKYIFLAFILSLGISLFFSSCKKEEEIEGCKDATAENFDSAATVDNGMCIYARDKFIGVFSGTLGCDAPLPNDEEFTLTIAEGLNNNAEVLISFQNVDPPLPELSARVEGSKLIIDPENVEIALDPDMPEVLTSLTYSGEVVIDESEENLSGELRVLLVLFDITIKCIITATKQ